MGSLCGLKGGEAIPLSNIASPNANLNVDRANIEVDAALTTCEVGTYWSGGAFLGHADVGPKIRITVIARIKRAAPITGRIRTQIDHRAAAVVIQIRGIDAAHLNRLLNGVRERDEAAKTAHSSLVIGVAVKLPAEELAHGAFGDGESELILSVGGAAHRDGHGRTNEDRREVETAVERTHLATLSRLTAAFEFELEMQALP